MLKKSDLYLKKATKKIKFTKDSNANSKDKKTKFYNTVSNLWTSFSRFLNESSDEIKDNNKYDTLSKILNVSPYSQRWLEISKSSEYFNCSK